MDGVPDMTERESIQSAEKLQTQSKWEAYFQNRFRNDRTFKASNITRDRSREAREDYKKEIIQKGLDLQYEFGIDDRLFSEPVNCEIFLAICDQFVESRRIIGAIQKKQQDEFLTKTLRLLAGSESKFNLDLVARVTTGADRFVDRGDTEKRQDEVSLYNELIRHKDPVRTEKLKQWFLDFSPNSPFAKVRKNLGINSENDEKEFSLAVLNLSWEKPKDKYGEAGQSDWEKITNADQKLTSAAFVYLMGDDLTIFVSKDETDWQEDEVSNGKTSTLIAHEYVHTQRSFRIGEANLLGQFFDENAANIAANHPGNIDAKAIINLLNELTPNGLNKKLKEATKDPGKQVEFYRLVADNFGFKSLLTLAATRPNSYTRFEVTGEIPEVRVDPYYRGGDLLKFVIGERLKIEPMAVKNMLSNLNPKWADKLLFQAQTGKVNLPTNLRKQMEFVRDQLPQSERLSG